MVGSTFSQWNFPIGAGNGLTYLCAELDPHQLYLGRIWTHLIQFRDLPQPKWPYYARIRESNVLDELQIVPKFAVNFPYGYTVKSDRVPT